jgi:predicted nucleotidyltransferase
MFWWNLNQAKFQALLFFAMQDELSDLLGRKVDLHTRNFLSPHFRDQVEAEVEIQYGAD